MRALSYAAWAFFGALALTVSYASADEDAEQLGTVIGIDLGTTVRAGAAAGGC